MCQNWNIYCIYVKFNPILSLGLVLERGNKVKCHGIYDENVTFLRRASGGCLRELTGTAPGIPARTERAMK